MRFPLAAESVLGAYSVYLRRRSFGDVQQTLSSVMAWAARSLKKGEFVKPVEIRVILMALAIGIIAPVDGGRTFVEIVGWILGSYALGIVALWSAKTWLRGDAWGRFADLSVLTVTYAFYVDMVPWALIGIGLIVEAMRLFLLLHS